MNTTAPPTVGRVPAKSRVLPEGPSILLDIVRILAAVTVAVGHVSAGFTTGWSPMLGSSFGTCAVAVFFVLSGFMIRYITRVKYGGVREYCVDRAARIYSVALPAIALTILFNLLSVHFNHAYNQGELGEQVSPRWSHAFLLGSLLSHRWFLDLVHIVLSLAMLSQSWFHDFYPLSNSPFWSLSYECIYYAVFGIAIYLKGAKRIAGWVLIFLLVGPTVFLLLPLWLLGCAAYDAYEGGVPKAASAVKLVGLSLLSIAGVRGSRALIDSLHAHWFYIEHLNPFMDAVAIATVAILIPLCIATRNLRISREHIVVRGIRKAAAATFPLYLTHYPLFDLLAAIVPYPRASLWAKLVLLGASFGLGLLLSGPCDRLKDYWRRKYLWPRRS